MAAKRDRTEPSGAVSQPGAGEEPSSAGGDSGRRQRIAEAAYYNAEHRGFEPGGEMDDWLEAERERDGRGPEKGARAEASARQSGSVEAGAGGTERPDFPDLNEAGIEHIEPEEIKQWAARLKVPAAKLREAIKRVGPVVRDVKQFLQDPASRS
jgi:hypothetical protein